MTFSMMIRTFFEILMFAVLVWGFFHEDQLAAFEQRLFCRFRRKKLHLVKQNKPALRVR